MHWLGVHFLVLHISFQLRVSKGVLVGETKKIIFFYIYLRSGSKITTFVLKVNISKCFKRLQIWRRYCSNNYLTNNENLFQSGCQFLLLKINTGKKKILWPNGPIYQDEI